MKNIALPLIFGIFLTLSAVAERNELPLAMKDNQFESINLFEDAVLYDCSGSPAVLRKFGGRGVTCLQVFGRINLNQYGRRSDFRLRDLSGGVLVFDTNRNFLGNLKLTLKRSAETPSDSVDYQSPPDSVGTILGRLLKFTQDQIKRARETSVSLKSQQNSQLQKAIVDFASLKYILEWESGKSSFSQIEGQPDLTFGFFYRGMGAPRRLNSSSGIYVPMEGSGQYYSRLEHYTHFVDVPSVRDEADIESLIRSLERGAKLRNGTPVWPA